MTTAAPPAPLVRARTLTAPQVTRRGLALSSFIAAASLFAAVNVATTKFLPVQPRSLTAAVNPDVQSASLVGMPQSWWTAKAYVDRASAPDIVLLGSSQMMCFTATDASDAGHEVDQLLNHDCAALTNELQKRGIVFAQQTSSAPLDGTAPVSAKLDEIWLKDSESVPADPGSQGPTVFNAAACGAMISDDYLTQHVLFQTGRVPRFVVLGIAPRDFIDGKLSAISFTEPFHFYVPFVGPGSFDASAFEDFFDRLNWQWFNELALRKTKNDFEKACAAFSTTLSVTAPQSITQELTPFDIRVNSPFLLRPGQLSITCHPFQGFIDNQREYHARYSMPSIDHLERQGTFLNRLLNELDQRGVKTILIGMPLHYDNRTMLTDPFWQVYRKTVKDIAGKHNVEFHDLSWSDHFDHSDFADGVHLNWRGARKLAGTIADFVSLDSFGKRNLRFEGLPARQ